MGKKRLNLSGDHNAKVYQRPMIYRECLLNRITCILASLIPPHWLGWHSFLKPDKRSALIFNYPRPYGAVWQAARNYRQSSIDHILCRITLGTLTWLTSGNSPQNVWGSIFYNYLSGSTESARTKWPCDLLLFNTHIYINCRDTSSLPTYLNTWLIANVRTLKYYRLYDLNLTF